MFSVYSQLAQARAAAAKKAADERRRQKLRLQKVNQEAPAAPGPAVSTTTSGQPHQIISAIFQSVRNRERAPLSAEVVEQLQEEVSDTDTDGSFYSDCSTETEYSSTASSDEEEVDMKTQKGIILEQYSEMIQRYAATPEENKALMKVVLGLLDSHRAHLDQKVHSVLTGLGFTSYVAKKRQLLNNLHKAKRILFCTSWLRSFEDWCKDKLVEGEDFNKLPEEREKALCLQWIEELNIHFSDEKMYTANYGMSKGFSLRNGSESDGGTRPVAYHYGQSAVKKMCWLAIGPRGFMAGPRWVEGTIDGNSYITMLKDTYLLALKKHNIAWNKCILQQDGASPHKRSLDELGGKLINFMKYWPPNSPDLNVIENFWWWVDRRKRKNRFIKTVRGLECCVESVMKGAGGKEGEVQEMIDSLLSSWTLRMRQVLERNGGRADY